MALESSAAADFVPALRIQTGTTVIRSPAGDSDDLFVAATPELTYFTGTDRTLVALTYSFTGSLNSTLPNGIANRLALTTATDITDTTRFLLGGEALQASIGNYILVRRSADTQLGRTPVLNTQLLTLSATQGIQHELSAVTRLTQTLTGSYTKSLDPAVRLNNYLATATLGVDRSWQFDSLGVELRSNYAWTVFPPIDARIVTVALGPRWVHDVNPYITTTLSVAGQVAFSPDPDTKPRVSPAGRGAILFFDSEGSGLEFSYAGGYEPNLLTGTILQSHLGQVRGFTPLSVSNRVILGLSAGYLRAKNLNLRATGGDNEFDAVLHDVDISWAATDYLQLFARYQFMGQASGDTTPAIVRHAGILGLQLSARRPDPVRVQTQFPQRVDQKDKPKVPERF